VLFVVSPLTSIFLVKLPAGDPARRADGKTTTLQQIESRAWRSGWTCPRGYGTRVRCNWSVMD